MKKTILIMILILVFGISPFCYAKHKHHSDDIWEGALIGAGVTLVGTELLDSRSRERVEYVNVVQPLPPVDAYKNGYQDGFTNGYKAGYTDGYKDGIKDEAAQHKQ